MTNGSEAELWEQGNWQHLVLDNLKDYAVLSLDLSGTILGWIQVWSQCSATAKARSREKT